MLACFFSGGPASYPNVHQQLTIDVTLSIYKHLDRRGQSISTRDQCIPYSQRDYIFPNPSPKRTRDMISPTSASTAAAPSSHIPHYLSRALLSSPSSSSVVKQNFYLYWGLRSGGLLRVILVSSFLPRGDPKWVVFRARPP